MEEKPPVQPKPESFSKENPQDDSLINTSVVPEKKLKKWIIVALVLLFLSVSIIIFFVYLRFNKNIQEPKTSSSTKNNQPTINTDVEDSDYNIFKFPDNPEEKMFLFKIKKPPVAGSHLS